MKSYELSKTIRSKICLVCNQQFAISDEQKCCPSDGSLLTPLIEDPLLGLVLDQKYEILSFIGSGGWSRVYKARHLHLDRLVAVKVLDANLVGDPLRLGRFQTEAKASNVLVHPNIVSVYDSGVLPQPFMAMEYVDGDTLDQIIRKQVAVLWEDALSIFSKVCGAMSYAHNMGFIHRDLTPRNIMLTSATNEVKVLDFGLVHVAGQDQTRTGDIIGSPPYMSPEQCRGEKLDARTDVYSLGCVMYAVLTGERPFEGQTSVESMYKHFNKVPPFINQLRPDLNFPKGLDLVVAKALAKDKNERYVSMEALKLDLEKVQSGTLKARMFRIRRNYKQSVKTLARISMYGNTTIITLFILLQMVIYFGTGSFANIW